ncbi:MAG: biotin--[acetyl-CoA-carboxylase] ligase [Bacteroidota bacterium]|nr:biotin--[acetyl-CoA-carboxylase] ligase [Bacteroidota bacterium]
MKIFTDNLRFTEEFAGKKFEWQPSTKECQNNTLSILSSRLFSSRETYHTVSEDIPQWQYLFSIEHAVESQYDVLIKIIKEGADLPDGILCIAGSGRKFHGQRYRAWESPPGNIYLSAFLAPKQPVINFSIGFTILSAVSVIQAIDAIPELRGKAMIKWINDIVIENSKVSGVIAQTHTQEMKVMNAVLGIGINVEVTPKVEPTLFVPKVASLFEFVEDKTICKRSIVFRNLIHHLHNNYMMLLSGQFKILIDFYRQRSAVIGREVKIISELPDEHYITSGRVVSITDNLELILEGVKSPISKGRLILESS